MQPFARVEAKLTQAGTELKNVLEVLLIGDKGKWGKLKELPLLLNFLNLALDDLLHLFRLGVHLNKATRTNSGTIGPDGGTALDDVEDGVNSLGGAGDESIFGLGVATGLGLASDLLVARRLDGEGRLPHLLQRHDTCCVGHGGGDVWYILRGQFEY